MNPQEILDGLYPYMGIYGTWLAEHGKELDKTDDLVIRISINYGLWYILRDDESLHDLFDSIDKFCEARSFPPPAKE